MKGTPNHPAESESSGVAMNERKRRHSQNNHLLREIMERLRDYEPDEVVIICNKFRRRRGLPPLEQGFLDAILPRK